MILKSNWYQLFIRAVSIFFLLFPINTRQIFAQEMVDIQKVKFTASEQNQIEKADELIMRGERLYSEVVGKGSDGKSRKHDGFIGKYTQKERDKDLLESHLRAISMYYAGYSKKSKVLKNRMQRFKAENPDKFTEMNQVLTIYEKKNSQASATYRKSRSVKTLTEAVKLGESAVDMHKGLQKEMFKNLGKLLAVKSVVTSQPVAVAEEPAPSKEVVAQDNTEDEVEPVQAQPASEPKSAAVIVPPAVAVVKEGGADELYFSIQILAGKNKVTDEQLARAYSGSIAVYENYGDGWYRYSVGKYLSYQEAMNAMQANNLKGHPVAYQGKKRVSLVEAKKLSEQETPGVSNKEIVKKEIKPIAISDKPKVGDTFFTIQIMADRKKTAPDQIKRIYSGSMKVDERKGDGWFRYSIGVFSTYEEAGRVMKREGVKGYIVAYSQSKRISISEAKKLLSN
ncbi:MAG: SPOR domain-containing protein [Marinilabiliaceae bacterium]|nr:SPOR domain-containing protein [Marinilabiliaceae bacterium]